MIPQFDEHGFLPEGVHQSSFDEFRERYAIFADSDRRFRLFEKIESLVDDARRSGIVKRIVIGGSFVSSKPEPNDFDCIIVLDSEMGGKPLVPSRYNLVSARRARRIYGGDVFSAMEDSPALSDYVSFFQTSRDGRNIGVVEIQL